MMPTGVGNVNKNPGEIGDRPDAEFAPTGNFPVAAPSLVSVACGRMIRIREILDPELRAKIVTALADRRGCSPAAIPEWFELDDADFVDLLNELKGEDDDAHDSLHDPRM